MNDLTSLIERIEAATFESQHTVIYDALVLFHRQSWITDNWYDAAMEMRRAGAFLDAVMTLMPEGMDWRLERNSDIRMGFGAAVFEPAAPSHYPGIRLYSAATPALALLAAILRARQAAQSGQAQTGARHD